MNFLLINQTTGKVENIVLCESEESAFELFSNSYLVMPEVEGVKVGDIYSTDTNTFSNEPVAKNKIKTKVEFLNLFTLTELASFYDRTKIDNIALVILKKMENAIYIDLDDSETIGGLQYFMSVGLINQTRLDQVLA